MFTKLYLTSRSVKSMQVHPLPRVNEMSPTMCTTSVVQERKGQEPLSQGNAISAVDWLHPICRTLQDTQDREKYIHYLMLLRLYRNVHYTYIRWTADIVTD